MTTKWDRAHDAGEQKVFEERLHDLQKKEWKGWKYESIRFGFSCDDAVVGGSSERDRMIRHLMGGYSKIYVTPVAMPFWEWTRKEKRELVFPIIIAIQFMIIFSQ